MPTPAIQTLLTDAQQVLNLNSLSEVRATMAAALANANVGTPLNPNLTTQQLWDEFYLIVRQPESDIESIITNQLMKFLFAPPAPGGVGANGQVIFNDGGVLAGDPQFLWNKTTNLLTVTGSATITGDLTVDTSTLYVSSSTDKVGIGTTSLSNEKLTVAGNISANAWLGRANISAPAGDCSIFRSADNTLAFGIASSTAMTLNSTGLGVGVVPSVGKLEVDVGAGGFGYFRSTTYSNLSITGRSGGAGAGGCQLFLTTTGSRSWLLGQRTDTAYGASNSFFIRDDTAAATRLEIDTSGNVGVGVAPSPYASTWKGLDISSVTGLFGSSSVGILGANVYVGVNGQALYKTNGLMSYYQQQVGTHQFYNAPSGTAGETTTVTSGTKYVITTAGGTNYTTFGAADNNVGTVFTASSSGTGNGGGVRQSAVLTSSMLIDANANIISNVTATPPTLTTNSNMVFNLTSNTNLRISVRGTDGTTRTANITLA